METQWKHASYVAFRDCVSRPVLFLGKDASSRARRRRTEEKKKEKKKRKSEQGEKEERNRGWESIRQMATWLKFAEQETTQITVLLLSITPLLPFSRFSSSFRSFSSFSLSSLHFTVRRSKSHFRLKRNSARDRVEESISHRVFFFLRIQQIVKKYIFFISTRKSIV